MADPARRRPENVPGPFFVDDSCIDCDQCRRLAPAVFHADGDQSAVRRQPRNGDDLLRAGIALVTCPTASIGTAKRVDLKPAIDALPEPVTGGVHFCGYSSERSFGASSWFAVRPAGNLLVDSPRFAGPLVKQLESRGGVATMFLTHKDDIADHAKFRARFGCARVMHRDDAPFPAERIVEGTDPRRLDDDLLVIPTPGHTRGHAVLLYRREILFTGDHLWWNRERGRLGASRSHCWHSWSEQIASMERLLDHSFEWVLPGHGDPVHLPPAEMRRHLEALIRRMRRTA